MLLITVAICALTIVDGALTDEILTKVGNYFRQGKISLSKIEKSQYADKIMSYLTKQKLIGGSLRCNQSSSSEGCLPRRKQKTRPVNLDILIKGLTPGDQELVGRVDRNPWFGWDYMTSLLSDFRLNKSYVPQDDRKYFATAMRLETLGLIKPDQDFLTGKRSIPRHLSGKKMPISSSKKPQSRKGSPRRYIGRRPVDQSQPNPTSRHMIPGTRKRSRSSEKSAVRRTVVNRKERALSEPVTGNEFDHLRRLEKRNASFMDRLHRMQKALSETQAQG